MKASTRVVNFMLLILLLPFLNKVTKGQNPISQSRLQEQAINWVQQYIKINTINPPGNEIAGAEFFADIFKTNGIKYEIIESAPGRGNIVAWLDGGNEPALMLLHHIDVVPADKNYWTFDPQSGELKNGYILGRGAIDTKSSGILHLSAFLALHQSGVRLKRKVIFMATADEEAGSNYGVGWLVKHRPDIFKNVGYVLTEGGAGTATKNGVNFGIEVTQKIAYWVRLRTTGPSGHASKPPIKYASIDLISGLEKLRSHRFATRIIPEVDRYFRAIAGKYAEPWKTRFLHLTDSIRNPKILKEFREIYPDLYSLTCNTCAITRISGSNKINVISNEAWAEIDCRLLPDENPEDFYKKLKSILGEEIEIQELMTTKPGISTTNTELYSIIEKIAIETFPNSTVAPLVQVGFTDSHFLRNLGVICYGFVPIAIKSEDLSGIHGNNERISEENIRSGVMATLKILDRFVAAQPMVLIE